MKFFFLFLFEWLRLHGLRGVGTGFHDHFLHNYGFFVIMASFHSGMNT